ncbi:MAG: M20/M25/M40 family metallo-hydrolase [Myxococcota bacterium]|jgi:acetylornithine deacetylase/succinyl-diaminopimelate desuccinylase-like protein|nr:M20/M25/M40 family metallo-hydrolase [Myxococcota bacterium]
MNTDAIRSYVEQRWDESIVPELEAYIRIPALSPHFDPKWQENGQLDAAVEHARRWCAERPIAGLEVEVVRLPGRTPVLFMEIPAANGGRDDRTVLLYGHLDKQPEMSGWDEGKGPWIPVRVGDKLYGRGGADDGYAAYASLTAIEALQKQKLPHDRCVVLIEACEESGSFDLPPYLDHLEARIGSPELVICLDSGCGNYDQLWSTTSLRGLVGGVLTVDVMEPTQDGGVSGVHSGDASGVVPSTTRILRKLLERIEDTATGEILIAACKTEIPAQRAEQAKAAAAILGDAVTHKFPLLPGTEPVARGAQAILNRTWRPFLEIVGVGHVPGLSGGNVLRSRSAFKLSLRIPPRVDGEAASRALKDVLESDPPYGAKVKFEAEQAASGWDAPPLAPWLEQSLANASRTFFGADAAYMGEGGTIPFMGMLGAKFPKAQFCITGVLGPASNAHGPNEFLHVPCAKKLTACMASVLSDFATL